MGETVSLGHHFFFRCYDSTLFFNVYAWFVIYCYNLPVFQMCRIRFYFHYLNLTTLLFLWTNDQINLTLWAVHWTPCICNIFWWMPMAFLTQTNAKLVSWIFIGLAILTFLFAIDVCSEKMTTRKKRQAKRTKEKNKFLNKKLSSVSIPNQLNCRMNWYQSLFSITSGNSWLITQYIVLKQNENAE